MFLKLFPRYAGRARRGATVAGDHLRGTAVVVENAPKSLSRHDGASTLQESQEKIVIPTPALAEVLTHAERAGADYFIKLNRSAAFRIESFGIRAAIELARMTASAIDAGDKREGVSAPWNKIKFDRQIVAIAKINNVSMIYSDDKNLAQFATAQGISVTTIGQLPLPPAEAQMDFVWDIVHEDDDTEDEGEFRSEEP